MTTASVPARRSLAGKLAAAAAARQAKPRRAKLTAAAAVVREHVVTAAALASVDLGCWRASQVAGWIVIGVSLLLLDFAVRG